MHDIPGKVIGLVLAVILCCIMPFVIITTEQEMVNRRLLVEDVSNFIDTVVDGRMVSDAELREFNANMAKYGAIYDYEIHHYKRSVNPDPVTGNTYTVSFVEVDDWKNYEKGDKISVHIWELSPSSTTRLSHRLTGLFVRDFDLTITARIR